MTILSSLPLDVLYLICVHCDSNSLTQLAATCQALSNPALEFLWNSLDSFATLIYTLPSDAWRHVEEAVDEDSMYTRKNLYIVRELTPSDFVRWHIYSRFIKSVGNPILSAQNLWIHRSAWDILERSMPGPLPNLQHVCYTHLDAIYPRYIEPISMFFGPALDELDVILYHGDLQEGEDHAPAIIRLIADLPHRSPNLRGLTFKHYKDREVVDDAMDGLVQQLDGLRSFCVSAAVRPRALLRLSSFTRVNAIHPARCDAERPRGADTCRIGFASST
ncbi:hypothetical protein C8Q76DRAFT_727326 [Earliella scabrosa]|nr:hypothetical protein C8Q76DRAFT_727326 [Earliella scabrosa]